MISPEIKYLVFDFGAVIINIDVPRAYQAFSELTGRTVDTVRELFEGGAYWKYEVGELDDAGFRKLIRETLDHPFSDAQIDQAWNMLLLDVPASRVALLRSLAQRYPIYLLSNTNPIHIRECTQIIKRTHGIENFRNLFQKCYMSFEIGMMKPDVKIYQHVLNDIGAKPGELLFLDDNLNNVEAAKALGIHTCLVTKEQDIHYWLEK